MFSQTRVGAGNEFPEGVFGCCCGVGGGKSSMGGFCCCSGHKAGGEVWFSLPEYLLKGQLPTAETRTLLR